MPHTEVEEIQVSVGKDRMAATLTIPAGCRVDLVNVDNCVAQFEANGVHVNSQSQMRLEAAVQAFHKAPDKSQHVTITGRCAVHGKPGRLEMSDQCTSAASSADTDDESENADFSPIDHYSRSPYILVKESQVIGRLLPPTDGEDGVDVFGKSVPARPGKAFPLKPDNSILVDASGQLISQLNGTLEQFDTSVRVNPVLTVDGRVDFETGNVEFDGDVVIGDGVCDNFKVNAKNNAVINGVVEGAELRTGGDLVLTAGMFGKDKGTLKTGRDCRAKFLQQVSGQINRNLIVDKEIINSTLNVTGEVDSPHASLIGGEYHAVGSVNLKVIGSETGIKTVLHMGSSPNYNRLLDAAIQKLDQLEKTIEKLQSKLDMLQSASRNMVAQIKEEFTEYSCEQIETQEQFESLKALVDTMTQRFTAQCSAEVTVQQMVYHDSVIVLGSTAAHFTKPIRGPITITGNHRGELSYRTGSGATQPIRSIARLIHWD